MKKLLILLFTLPNVLSAQTYFQKYYGSLFYDDARAIEILNDSMIAISGLSFVANQNTFDATVLILDNNGNILQQHLFDANSNHRCQFNQMQKAGGNNIFLGGNIAPTGSIDNWVVAKVTPTGSILMQSYFGNFGNDEQLQGMFVSGEHFIICGTDANTNEGYIGKIDTLGNSIWRKKFNMQGNSTDNLSDIVETTNQDYLTVGQAIISNTSYLSATLLDNNGNLVWAYRYDDGFNNVTNQKRAIVKADGNNFFIINPINTGSNNLDILIIKIDNQGNVLWAKSYGGSGDDICRSIKKANDGNYVLCGNTTSIGFDEDAFLMKMDVNGNILWNRAYGDNGDDYFEEVEPYISGVDSFYYLAGRSSSFSGNQDIYLVKVNEQGQGLNSNCYTVQNLIFNVQNRNVSRVSGGSLSNWTPTTNHSFSVNPLSFNTNQVDCINIDLDLDNNSGAANNDYLTDTVCYSNPIPIADNDLEVVSNTNTLDSVQIFITSGISNGNNEFLNTAINTNLIINGLGTNQIIIIGNGNTTIDTFEHIIRNITYNNTATNINEGQRIISVIGYENNMMTPTANCFIYLSDNAVSNFDLGDDITLCIGDSTTLDATVVNPVSYTWQDGTTLPTFLVTQSGTYSVTITNQCGTLHDSIGISITGDSPTLNLDGTIEICIGESVNVDASTDNADIYLWSTGETNPVETFTTEGLYIINATNNCGTSSDSIYVSTVDCSCFIGVPNVFSPNNDGRNDSFKPQKSDSCNFVNYQFKIFNRWGHLVFESTNIDEGWNGIYQSNLQPQDTYVWILEYELSDGQSEVLKGNVLLVK